VNPLWLKAAPWVIILALFAGIAVLSDRLKAAHAETEACEQARKADRQSYIAAQAQAKANNLQQVRTIEQKQEANNGQAISNLRTDLERIRRELRTPAGTDKGPAGSAGTPEADSPGGTSDPSCLHLTPEERLRGAEDEARHAELVNLIKQAKRLLNE
jgi:hypothetical protein